MRLYSGRAKSLPLLRFLSNKVYPESVSYETTELMYQLHLAVMAIRCERKGHDAPRT
jgi:hypothetical protein